MKLLVAVYIIRLMIVMLENKKKAKIKNREEAEENNARHPAAWQLR